MEDSENKELYADDEMRDEENGDEMADDDRHGENDRVVKNGVVGEKQKE